SNNSRPKEKSSSRESCWSFKQSESRSRCPHATHEGQRVGCATALARRDAMEATKSAEQSRTRVETHHFHDVLDGQFAATEQAAGHGRTLTLQVLVRRHVVDVLEQSQEVMPRQERGLGHVT